MTAWYTFVILHAYYGGALTMFFAGEPTLPFKTIEDVMMKAPEWKIMMIKGTEETLRQKEIYEWYQKAIENTDFTVDTIKDGIHSLTEGNLAFYAPSHKIRKFFNEKLHDTSLITTLADENPKYYALALTKNSPLMPYFKKIAFESLESGLTDALLLEWIGPKIKHLPNNTTDASTVGQTLLIFILMILMICFSLLVYIAEVVTAKMWVIMLKDRWS